MTLLRLVVVLGVGLLSLACGEAADPTPRPSAADATDSAAGLPDGATATDDTTSSDSITSPDGSDDAALADLPPVRVPSACWQSACSQLWAACGSSADCVALSVCVSKNDRAGCKTQAGPAASQLWADLQSCAAANCRDPYAGTCADRCGKAKPPDATCACDPQCEAYGDCCWDYAAECKKKPTPATSCVGLCGQFLGNDVCNCDDACVDYNDCCSDFLPVCKPQADAAGGDADAVDGPADASAVDDAAEASADSL